MSIKISGFQTGSGPSGPWTLPQYGSVPTNYSTGSAGSGATITFSAPANSTTILTVSTDGYGNGNDNNAGYFPDFTNVSLVANSGAQYWEYMWVQYQQNSSIVTNQTSNASNSFTGGWISIAETLMGTSAPPSYVAAWEMATSNQNTCTLYNVSINDGEIAVLSSGVEKPGVRITGISGGGLVWTRKSSKSHYSSHEASNAGVYQTSEIWYAVNNSGNTIQDNVQITYENQFDDQAAIISTWSGVNLTSPWA